MFPASHHIYRFYLDLEWMVNDDILRHQLHVCSLAGTRKQEQPVYILTVAGLDGQDYAAVLLALPLPLTENIYIYMNTYCLGPYTDKTVM